MRIENFSHISNSNCQHVFCCRGVYSERSNVVSDLANTRAIDNVACCFSVRAEGYIISNYSNAN